MTDKARRKEIRDQLRSTLKAEFEKSLPMSREKFQSLFDYIDIALREEKCNDDHTISIRFLNLIGEDEEVVIPWLIDNDGFCDCETLANVEEKFE